MKKDIFIIQIIWLDLRLIYYYEYATGIKTGYTSYAKNCLVSSAEKNGMEYFAVVLGAEVQYAYTGTYSARYVDTISLFDYVFDNFFFLRS